MPRIDMEQPDFLRRLCFENDIKVAPWCRRAGVPRTTLQEHIDGLRLLPPDATKRLLMALHLWKPLAAKAWAHFLLPPNWVVADIEPGRRTNIHEIQTMVLSLAITINESLADGRFDRRECEVVDQQVRHLAGAVMAGLQVGPVVERRVA